MKQETPPRAWPREIFDVFKQVGIEQIAFVPDAGHTQLIKDCEADNAMETVSLTTEEEGVACCRRLARRQARRAADAVVRRRQLHQHAVACRTNAASRC